MKDLYVIYIHVKPYVRTYLRHSFGISSTRVPDLIDIRSDQKLRKTFLEGLTRHAADNRPTAAHRTCRIAVRVSYDTFQRLGTALTPAAEKRINVILETRCRNIMLAYVSTFYIITGNLARAIQLFYDKTEYDEFTWPVDSIRKAWYREEYIPKKTFFDDIINKFADFITEKLSHN